MTVQVKDRVPPKIVGATNVRKQFIFERFVRFSMVGVVNTIVDVGLFNLFVWLMPTSDPFMLVVWNSIAYIIASGNSFVWNKFWSFRHRQGSVPVQLWKFLWVTLLGVLCNDVGLWLMTQLCAALNVTGPVWVNLSKLVAIGGSMSASFIGLHFWVFLSSVHNDTPTERVPAVRFPFKESVSIVLPAYNEEATIECTILTILNELPMWVTNFEVVVVDDGSTDTTEDIIEYLSRYDVRVRLVSHDENRGYGAALVTGFKSARMKYIFFTDSDGQFEISDIRELLPYLSEVDAVFGYRMQRKDAPMRLANAWLWGKLVWFMFGIRVRDVDCAFKIFHREFFQKVSLETEGAMINTEMIYKFCREGYVYTEVGVHHLPRTGGRATGAKLSVIIKALRDLLFYAEKWSLEESRR